MAHSSIASRSAVPPMDEAWLGRNRIIALSFESPLLAQQALLAALDLQEHGKLALHDAVFVTRCEHGPAEVISSMDPTPVAAAVPSSLFGALVGTLVAGPLGFLVGGVLAGSTGALLAKLVDTGIPHAVVTHLRELTEPGRSVLALLISDFSGSAVIGELHRFQGAHVVYADLSPDALELVRRALDDQEP